MLLVLPETFDLNNYMQRFGLSPALLLLILTDKVCNGFNLICLEIFENIYPIE